MVIAAPEGRTMTVGFIGMGIMGSAMAANLVAAGHEVTVWNRTRFRAESISGAAVANSPAELAAGSNPVMICVSDSPGVEEVALGPDGALAGMGPGTVIVDHSTISPAVTRRLGEATTKAGGTWLDAPVSGGSEGAVRGNLAVMVGGDPHALAEVESILRAYAASITHIGPTGSGQLCKLVNQILVAVNELAVSEALLFAQAAGLDPSKALEAVRGGAAGSWMLSNRGPQMIARDWTPGFTIDLQQKDLRLVLEEADAHHLSLPGTSIASDLYHELQRRGLGAEGNHAMVKALEDSSGFRLGDGTKR
jgi:3-hydroxyisobutyrate dehydrogenase